MSKLKEGDVVFVSGMEFTRSTNSYVKMGQLLIIEQVGLCWYYIVDMHDDSSHFWGANDAERTLTKWNKKNWCRVFLQFMEMQK